MGVEERMADRCNTIRLYSFQTDVVYQVLKRDGVCYSKEEYVRKKYKESAKVFINAYGWFVKEAQHIVPKPEGAEYPYWAFTDLYNVDQTGDGHVLPPFYIPSFKTHRSDMLLRSHKMAHKMHCSYH